MMILLVINLILMFLVHFLQDILSAYYLRLVSEERIILASIISFVHSLLGWCVWIWFMSQLKNPEALTGLQATASALGSAMGTYLGLRKPGQKIKPHN